MPESRTSLLSRVAALITGLAILLAAAAITYGLVLCAPLGVWVAHRFRRARGRSLGGWSSWLSAVGVTAVGLLLVAGIFASRLPVGSWSRIRQTVDSASANAAQQPPPAWLDRIAPRTAARSSRPDPTSQRLFSVLALIWGIGIFVGFFGSALGTIGWIGSMLLIFYASGHWLRAAPALVIEPDTA
jgi:hypothetical protein